MKQLLLASITLIFSFSSFSQDYSNYTNQVTRLEKLAGTYPQYAKLGSIAKTSGGKTIWLLTLGTGDVGKKPAIAVIGGVEGNHLLGTELAIGFAERLLQSSGTDSIKQVLQNTTYYVFPNMSPDAMEQYFSPMKYERQGNAKQTDDDRDGKINEDPYDDLDGNGKITLMRVESPIGEYRLHPDEKRILIKADVSKGEKGMYKIYTEGIDNDKDGQFNEDGEGGVWFNKSLTFKPPVFTQGAGEFPVSEPEARALLDTLYQMFNVFAVVSFSSMNNLSAPQTYNAQAASQRIVGSWLEEDVKTNAMVSDLYNKITQTKDAPKTTPAGGDLFSWSYYHYGRLSFSTPGWWVPKATPDTAKKEKAFSVEDPVANYLRWSSSQGIQNTFTEWKAINHPDFPEQKVEVGGIDPFVMVNPPYRMVDTIIKKHTDFLTRLSSIQPEIEIANVRSEKIGNGLTRITADIINKGVFPSHSKLGERNYWIKRINVRLNPTGNQTVVSGKKNQLLNVLPGYGSQKITWLIKGSGRLVIEAGSPATGIKTTSVPL